MKNVTKIIGLRSFLLSPFSFLLFAQILLFAQTTLAQFQFSGKVIDAESQTPLIGANVVLVGNMRGTYTNAKGEFLLKNVPQGSYVVRISFVGFESATLPTNLDKDNEIKVSLSKSTFVADEVVVSATRANAKTATAFTNVGKDELQAQNLATDLPVLLNFTPSMVTTTDAGAGVGYTGMRIRGTDATRINVTINGIPYNDPESAGTYFVDLPDLASSVSSIQIQRGVGTSTNGAGAFGATVNIQTNEFRKEAYAEINNSVGSYNTMKNTIMAGSGLLGGKFTFDARLSRLKSDGYIDRASSDMKSFYLSGGYFGAKSFIRLNVFSGMEKTYQAWEGVPENLLATNRTYNLYTYPNQTDNYQQDHYQLLSSHTLSNHLTLNINGFYVKGKGYYEQFKEAEKFSKYGLADLVIGTQTIKKTDLVRRKWLDNDFYGTTFSLDYNDLKKLQFNIGGGWNQYNGGHYGEIIWAKYTSNSTLGYRWYENNSVKNDFNLYTKAYYQLAEKLNAFADLQFRTVGYTFKGIADKRQDISQTADYQFFNPKIGLTYQVSDWSSAYLSWSVGQKEPSRQDFLDNAPKAPLAEKLYDLEAGYKYQAGKVALSANVYSMNYTNQLVLTGKVNDVGAAIRTNVPESYRRGIELEAGIALNKTLKISANAAFSQNKIKNFAEVVPNYDGGADKVNNFAESDISFSPNVVIGSILSYSPHQNLELSWLAKHVGKQYLDNTSSETRKLNSYFTNDLRAIYSLKGKTLKNITLTLLVNNVFSTLYESNGYSYSYIYGGETITENFYYPQATRNFMLGLGLKF